MSEAEYTTFVAMRQGALRCARAPYLLWCISLHSCTLLLIALFCTSLRADDAIDLDRYLERLGATDLRLVHFEQRLAAASDGKIKASLAKELSDLYAQRLLEAADEPQRFGELVTRVEKLVADYPAVDSPQLKVMLLQADYQRAEAKALQWIDDPAHDAARQQAADILERTAGALTDHRRKLAREIDELQSEADAVEDDPSASPRRKLGEKSIATLEKEMNRLQAVMARALFFEGWAHFFHAIVARSQAGADASFADAEVAFSQLLEVPTDSEKLDLEPETLGLESVWRARGLMGLGATLAALGKPQRAGECFTAIEHPSTAPSVRENALYWQLLALVGSQRYRAAEDLASAEFSQFAPGHPGGTPACVLLVRTGWADSKASDEVQRLARIGLEGLARLRQFDVLTALVAKHRSQPSPADGFYALWGKGKLVFAEAEKSMEAADYERAADWFGDALAMPQAKDDPVAAAQCRYSLAWCHYRREEYDEAIRLFDQAAAQLKALGDDTAVQSAWMAFTCHQQLHGKTNDERHQKAAVESLVKLRRDFPGTQQAQRAELLLARLSASGDSPEIAVEKLAQVPSNSPNYLAARYELCVARHQLWAKARDRAKAELAEDVLKDVETYLAAAPQSEGTKRLRASLLAVDVLLSGKSPDWEKAGAQLIGVRSIGDGLDDKDSLAPEYHYRLLQLAQRADDASQINRRADWLAAHAAGTPYELPALVIVARGADERLAAASEAEKGKRRSEAIAAYTRLVALLGESAEAIAAKKNALVANSKLAQYEYDAGLYAQAAKRMEAIVEAHPSERNYLRRAGLAWIAAKGYARALPHWNTLAAGNESASDPWYEAKYYQLLCLAQTDRPAFEKSWRQFKLLHPEVKSAAWKERFADLDKK
jgi:tetratricopeptide (TPR) repeat protein